jgi:hypothetical protein
MRHKETVMQCTSRHRSFPSVLAFALALAALAAPPASAELATWDQARVTAIAKQLSAAADAWELAVREQGGDEVGAGDAQDEFGLANGARVLKEQSAALAAHLADGKGYDKTVDLYKTLKEMVDDTEDDAQRAELDEPTMGAWAKFADAMRQIAPYYDPKANAGSQ